MITIKQVDFSSIINKNFDILIAASGFETRASWQVQQYLGIADTKIVLGFKSESNDPIRKQNDDVFKEKNFKSIIIEGEYTGNLELENIIGQIFEVAAKKNHVDIYIDYSSMTKNLYAYILYAVNNLYKGIPITITLGYTHGKFVPYNGKDTLNRIVSPLFGYCNLSVPYKPTALIIGVGDEPNRIYGLQEYFDAVTYLFYTDTSYNGEYTNEIESINKDFIAEVKPENIIRFPIHDLIYTNYLLENLCKVLSNNFRIIIAPCGPKPFALLAMLNSLKYENLIEVWRISPGNRLSKIDRIPTGLVSALEVKFSE